MNHRESNFVSAVICVHKEDNNIQQFLRMLYDIFSVCFNKYEIICVNEDGESQVVEAVRLFKSENPDSIIRIINMGGCQGLEACMNAGVDLSIGDYVFEFDSCYIDYDRELIMKLYRKALEGYDIVTAVPPSRQTKAMSQVFYFVYNHFSKAESELSTERFRVISRRAVNRVSAYSKTIPYRKAVYASSGLKEFAVQYELARHTYGKRIDDLDKNNTAMDALVIFTNFAYKISLALSLMMAFFMVGAGAWTMMAYFSEHRPVAGWAPLMGLICVGFFSIFVLLTVIIKYLEVLVRLIFKKQKYLISSIEKL